jgi:radical SAM superfamily enzyme YgiQ (UPF0313 family)
MKILIIYPLFPETFWSFKYALKFVNKKASSPPLGAITVAAMLPMDWTIKLVDMNIQLLKDSDILAADMVFISAMSVQQDSVDDVIKRCKKHKKIIVAGGPLFTGDPERYPQVDHLVLNEAEITLPRFLEDLAIRKPQHIYSTNEFADITKTPMPRWDLLDMPKYDAMAIQYTRGCPFNCDFCNVTALLGHQVRIKTTRQLIGELDKLYDLGWRRNLFLVDDNFIGNKTILKNEVLPELIRWRKGKDGCLFTTEASINMADDPELMNMMADAGFTSIFVGIETPEETSLDECHKVQNKNRSLLNSIKKIQDKGMQVMGGFIVGFDNDTPEIFDRQIRFIQESGIVTAMVGLLQAPFGTELYKKLEKQGRLLKEMSGDNANGKTNIITKMDLRVLQDGYKHIIDTIFSPKPLYQRIRTFLIEFQPVRRTVTLQWDEIAAFFRSMWYIGILGEERIEYWKLFWWTLFRFPSKFPMAITLTIYGFHFRTVTKKINVNVAETTA